MDQKDFEIALRREIHGEVCFDEVTRGIYATDASHYQVMPQCVVTPRSQGEALSAIRIASKYRVPITARGAGTSLSGQTTWTGMVLDVSRHLNSILEVNVEEKWARVEPGVVRDQLNDAVAAHRLHFAPDPATSSRATIGGMIGNNSSGTRSIMYGKSIDHVMECTVVLADGTILQCRPLALDEWAAIAAGEGREAQIYRRVREIVEANRDEILARYPTVMRRVSGYNLDAFASPGNDERWNLANLICGSEGTLATLLEAKIALTPLPLATAVCVVHFDDVFKSYGAVQHMLPHQPSAIELLDRKVIEESQQNPTTKQLAEVFVDDPEAVLIVEFSGDDQDIVSAITESFAEAMQQKDIGISWPIRTDAAAKRDVWELRKLGLGLIENKPGKKGKACIEDACVPVERLEEYGRAVHEICERHGVGLTSYAHASVGVLHFRPELELKLAKDVERMRSITEEVFALVKDFGGSFSSEHGDGLVRGEFISKFYGEQIYEAFRQIKTLFDPIGVMNPGKIVDPAPMTENLRYGEHYQPLPVETLFQYRDHGDIKKAVEKCSGVGACRKLGDGTMCPSYMATRDEQHSTRGRANALRLAMSGQLSEDSVTSDRIHEMLELCLACKACKSECPTAVDVSRFKADVLQMRYDRFGTPRSAHLVANLPKFLKRIPLPVARAASWVQKKLGFEQYAMNMLGFDQRRPLPQLALKSFATWYAEYRASNHHDFRPHGKVAIFVDTFTNYFEPSIGKAAVRLLEQCGYEVVLAEVGCCQRSAISKGLLRDAKNAGERTISALARFEPELSLVVLEPSCASALCDDLPDLVDNEAAAQQMRKRTVLLEEFLESEFVSGRLAKVHLRTNVKEMAIHGHCHQKAIFGMEALTRLLQRVRGLKWSLIDAGCCGMAGSFGYEHYDVSQAVGEDRLFPAIRELGEDVAFVATGMSCRQQVEDFLDVDARHWCEFIEASRQ